MSRLCKAEIHTRGRGRKLDAVFRQCFPRAIENSRRFAAGLFVERPLVRHPRATGVFQAHRF